MDDSARAHRRIEVEFSARNLDVKAAVERHLVEGLDVDIGDLLHLKVALRLLL